jgi:hypothetical protein
MKLDLSVAAVLFRALSDAVAQMVELRRQALAGAPAQRSLKGERHRPGLGVASFVIAANRPGAPSADLFQSHQELRLTSTITRFNILI